MAKEIKVWNDNPLNKPIRYSSAVGEFQFTGDPASIEREAKILYDRYLNKDYGGPKYHYYLNGKPLMVVYAGNIDISLWENYKGEKKYSDKFTIRWANNDSVPGYYGWAYDKGTKYNEEVMVVMAGWRNMVGHTPVLRNFGEWYKNSWETVLNAVQKPKIVIINSFNEYAERTGVWVAQTSHMTDTLANSQDRWINSNGENDPYMYWDMTVENIKKFKGE